MDYETGCMYESGHVTGGYTNGYWTSTSSYYGDKYAWNMGPYGNIECSSYNETGKGVRPVLEISKSLINN